MRKRQFYIAYEVQENSKFGTKISKGGIVLALEPGESFNEGAIRLAVKTVHDALELTKEDGIAITFIYELEVGPHG